MRSPRSAVANMAAIAMLAGCTPPSGARPEPAPPPEAAPANEQASCGADKLDGYLGAIPSPDVLAKIKAASGAAMTRVVGPDDMMTMDFRPDRLTIHTGDDGRIIRFRCI
ncbi:I78 family peptidase inhibitor [Novosphingobium sp. RD2P27]|uniref:I78 family peptidase inhibitor n=1 Tax=Novosphingobium kalidii TaxID=3230299 RepID=A0ABV2D322_9SPHN